MTHTVLPSTVRRFLIEQIGSFERLTVLLVMHRHAKRGWGAHALAVELAMAVDAVHLRLEHLSRQNLLDVRVGESLIYRYRPGTEELAELVERVADAHYAHRDAVAAALVRRPSDSARLFADAFRLRKGERDA